MRITYTISFEVKPGHERELTAPLLQQIGLHFVQHLEQTLEHDIVPGAIESIYDYED